MPPLPSFPLACFVVSASARSHGESRQGLLNLLKFVLASTLRDPSWAGPGFVASAGAGVNLGAPLAPGCRPSRPSPPHVCVRACSVSPVLFLSYSTPWSFASPLTAGLGRDLNHTQPTSFVETGGWPGLSDQNLVEISSPGGKVMAGTCLCGRQGRC